MAEALRGAGFGVFSYTYIHTYLEALGFPSREVACSSRDDDDDETR